MRISPRMILNQVVQMKGGKVMHFEEARHQLFLHGPGTVDQNGEPLVLEDGFLGCLRPYRGLHERNFHCVMEALLSVGEVIHKSPLLERDLVYAIWSICNTAHRWGLARDGMLQRNRLITPADTARLELWVTTFEKVALRLLIGWPPHQAVFTYAEYVIAEGWADNVTYFVDLMTQAVADSETSDGMPTFAQALSKLGAQARLALPALRAAEHREYSWYTPIERCTEETRGVIRQAIQAIEG